MTWWQAILLGLLQGVTEFLPVSSSGHLVLAQYVLGIELTEDVAFEVMLHFGTALSIITVYRNRIVALIGGMLRSLPRPLTTYRTQSEVRIGWHILIATIPVAVAYILMGDTLESAFTSPRLACLMLIVTGILLWLTLLAPQGRRKHSAPTALITGVAQMMALLPGISRSGSTICTGMYLKVDPETATDFSFLMVLPPILGAALLKTIDLVQATAPIDDWVPILLGTVVAYGSGVVAIMIVLNVVRRGRLHYFAYYCAAVGVLGLILLPASSVP